MGNLAIRVENLSKQYRIGGPQARYKTLRETLTEGVAGPFRRLSSVLRGRSSVFSKETIWALKDVSFEVKRGEVVGIIGRNGAGKTTLLKVLSRITKPTEGRAEVHGRVGSLLEVGTGFHPELTGRENIYLNGAILGMKKAEIERKFDEIVEFAEIEKFLDTPVKRYSSGMYVRLAFAVAAHLEPEILLVDEVLAVGDAAFQKKCLGKMGDVAKEGRTVLFVSHNMTAVQTLCSRAVRLDQGYLMDSGAVGGVVSSYLKSTASDLLERQWHDTETAPGNPNVKVLYAGVETGPEHDRSYLTVDTPIDLAFTILNFRAETPLHFNVHLYNQESICVFNTASRQEIAPEGIVQGVCRVPAHLLNDNVYTVRLMIHYQGAEGIDVQNILTFEVHDSDREEWAWYGEWIGVVRPRLEWSVKCSDAHPHQALS